ncbi:glycosyltransferase family 4 protein [uncultured Roseobacter sp.]|uniref:glycosyltransferase family 4 protein n=1 Tax=uncultured Roseobacter sp. TaxID=114847 RepID=UPI0026340DE7|nr:glycosyltransferase family 4 protein [uncultured Roseobacter sp.]
MTKTNNRIRVLFPFVGGNEIGGSHISAMMLIRNLDPNRFEPRILIHHPAGPFADMLTQNGDTFDAIPDIPILGSKRTLASSNSTGAVGYLRRSLPALRAVLKRINADIVHTNDGRMHSNWSLPTRLSGRAHLWHHRQDPDGFGINKIAPLLANRIVTVSEYAKPNNPLRSIEKRCDVVHSPFDFDTDPPDPKAARAALCAELDIEENALILGYFGTIIVRKRPDHFVRSVAAIQAQVPDTPVYGLIFGEVERPESRLDETVPALANQLGIGARVKLMGFRSPIHEYMAGIDAMLVPALNEPFGRTLIEAMYLGTPVIATNHGGNPEAITDGKTGFLVDKDDPEAFVEPVLKLKENPDLKSRIVSAAKADVLENYGTDKHVSKISAIYEGLIACAP